MHQKLRRDRFINGLIKHEGNQTKAALEAGYAPSTATKAGNRLINKPDVRAAVLKILDEMDIATHFRANWLKLLTRDVEDPKDAMIVLKTQEQISKIAGLEAPKRTEALRANVSDFANLLPKGELVRTEVMEAEFKVVEPSEPDEEEK